MKNQLSLHLTIVSQESKLLEVDVVSFTVPTSTGEITVLPNHISLFTQLEPGELEYRIEGEKQEYSFVVSKGFLDVNIENSATAIVDSAVDARKISTEKAKKAIQAAQETIRTSEDKRELLLAEASIRQAMLEIKIAQKSKKSSI